MKTTEEIWYDLDIHSKQALMYDDKKLALGSKEIEQEWYSSSDVEEIKRKLLEEVEKIEEDIANCIPKEFIKTYKSRWKMLKHPLLDNKTEVEKND